MTNKTSNILYYSGLISLAIGAFGLTFAAFFAIIGLPVFIVGLILVLVSLKKTWKQRLIPIGLFVIGIVAFWPIWNWSAKVEPETFLIPQDYRGKVHILFNEPCGDEAEYENKRRLHRIPDGGILTTTLKDEYGIIDQEYYLVDENGIRTPLSKMDVRDYNEEWTTTKNLNEPSRNKLGVFHTGRVGNGEHFNEGKYYYQEFYVGTYQQLKDSFDHKYEKKFDSLEYEILKKCRGLK